MDYRETYKGHAIKVYTGENFIGGTKWFFDIYNQRQERFVHREGIAESASAALAAARKWIDQHPIA